ncbi:23S rRNA (pseudouridine(1915)-N(3))-methyltransferase RlmH [Parasporobacterium paucivorans]|uniref:Ribosomal RNA large subunit methyltransferase H n=1 Tax=Parasporobacterium paucivorans DSM 15970 TaxID=1122934 RepID=A0A1M6EMB3_9FIRM|nr:23S rRNA (pseudouridine(1915)-N(3))-methyltransferase RlmH [Parasporobacterium paucivorans]SHI86632.1 23S rRNA (pseudouridine1915-N3)-methyltransferase [Parasporobacterium paucivorans DSM 15970]
MKITILTVGKIKEKYLSMAIDEYSKRLGRYCKLEIIETPDEKVLENASQGQEEIVKSREAERILKNVKEGSYVITLEIDGKQFSSEELARHVEGLGVDGISHITFIIGGSIGLHENISRIADLKLSFSRMTFPHQLMRVILLEQIYRSFRIINGEPYHK